MNKLLLLLIVFSFISETSAQNNLTAVPPDTSYTIYSAYQKLINKFPFIKIAQPEMDKIKIKENIIYKEYDERKLRVDIFEPKGNKVKLSSAVILIHGGGWRSGNKSMMHPLAIKLAENNFAVFTVEYRLSPEAKFPAAVYDLKDAVKWVKANSSEFRIDTNRIAMLGCSAGGTLAAFIGATIHNRRFENRADSSKISGNINAVIDVDRILDFTHHVESGKDLNPAKPSAGKLWLGASYEEDPEKWREASPINYIDENTPPILFINSSEERYRAGRYQVIEKLIAYNIYYEVHEIENSPHTFWLFHPWFDNTINLIINFLGKVLSKNK